MPRLQLYSAAEVQQDLARHLRALRRAARLSRAALATRSTVPAATIKRLETTGQISLRQFLLLWQTLDDLRRIHDLTTSQTASTPRTISEVLAK